ncbi:hypothetical protein LCL95_04495 [Bacillus timonensis]|nr:hypothetical protein [Bacillus timonensis]
MELKENMEFDITVKFIPNFCQARTLTIKMINHSSVCIEMEDAKSRGVFPIRQFEALIRDGALIYSNSSMLGKEDTA